MKTAFQMVESEDKIVGYYANGDGIATFKDGVNIRQVEEILNDILDELYAIEFDIVNENEISICDTDKYHEDEILTFLNALAPYIKEGKMTYSGDDNCNWRFVFDPENECWLEESGIVDYNFESYTDEDLITEIEKRGYKVTK